MTTLRKIFAGAAASFMAFSAAAQVSAEKLSLPSGWKLAAPVTRSGCDRKKSDLLTAVADFDGDKKEDVARLLTRKDGPGLAVWVWLAAKKAPVLVAEFVSADGKHDIGIAPVDPGSWATACGKGYWECKPGEPARLKLTTPALNVFTCESANQFVYWDSASGTLKSVWMSD